uniref:Uncharacterized protein n=1 Tax=Timema genevievae TaxID=629358 RepID=A0A7R9K524_TIMGE|nr:unnamed protein product [Timema genevievae]
MPSKQKANVRAGQPSVDPSDEMHNSDNVSWTLEQEAGVMLVQFHLMRGINKYELALLQTSSPPPGEEICPDQYETHSKITYELGSKSDNITMCGKVGKVTFQYVSSGCYTLEVTKHGYDGGYTRIHTFCPLNDCIKTNYIVKYIDTETTYNIAIRQGSRLEITFTHNDSIHWLREYVLTKNDTLEKIEWEVQVDKCSVGDHVLFKTPLRYGVMSPKRPRGRPTYSSESNLKTSVPWTRRSFRDTLDVSLSEKLSCEYGNAAHPTRCWMFTQPRFGTSSSTANESYLLITCSRAHTLVSLAKP